MSPDGIYDSISKMWIFQKKPDLFVNNAVALPVHDDDGGPVMFGPGAVVEPANLDKISIN